MTGEPPRLPLLDRLVAWLAPQRALRRQRARVALAAVRAFEGAAKSRRTEGWRVAVGTGPNTELAPALATLRDRSRDSVRNNGYARRAVRHLASSLVGYGITGTVIGKNKRSVAALQAAWDEWANARTCDQRGKQTFGGLQRLVAREFCESGEVLARRVWDAAAPMGFRVQVLEPDYLDAGVMPRVPIAEGHRYVAGVEVDADDRPVAYWLLPQHPGETWAGMLQTPVAVPAADVAHVFDEERAGQGRGYPLLTPVMIALRDLDECKDAHQVRQKVAACYTAFLSTPEGATRAKTDPLCDHVEPGMIEELPPGYEVTFGNPPGVEGYADVMRLGLQAVAAGTSVPYEDISGDFSQFNFSSGRMSRGAFYALIEELQWSVLIPDFNERVFTWFLEAARIEGYETAGVEMTWTTPRRPLVDPAREVPAVISQVRATLASPQEAIRELGYDPESVLREWSAFTKLLDDMRLISDIDPRRVSRTGNPTPEWVGPGESIDEPASPPPAANGARVRRRAGRRPPPSAAETNGDVPPA
jgi:lambda family phage portal protein